MEEEWTDFVVCCAEHAFVADVRVKSSRDSDRWAVVITPQGGPPVMLTGGSGTSACDFLRGWTHAVEECGMRETG